MLRMAAGERKVIARCMNLIFLFREHPAAGVLKRAHKSDIEAVTVSEPKFVANLFSYQFHTVGFGYYLTDAKRGRSRCAPIKFHRKFGQRLELSAPGESPQLEKVVPSRVPYIPTNVDRALVWIRCKSPCSHPSSRTVVDCC